MERYFLFDAINLRRVITASVLQEDFLFLNRTKLTKNKAEKLKKCHNKNFKTIIQDAFAFTAMPVWWFKIPPARRCDVTCIKSTQSERTDGGGGSQMVGWFVCWLTGLNFGIDLRFELSTHHNFKPWWKEKLLRFAIPTTCSRSRKVNGDRVYQGPTTH